MSHRPVAVAQSMTGQAAHLYMVMFSMLMLFDFRCKSRSSTRSLLVTSSSWRLGSPFVMGSLATSEFARLAGSYSEAASFAGSKESLSRGVSRIGIHGAQFLHTKPLAADILK